MNPKENRTQPAFEFIEQFRRKGYSCHKLKENDRTIVICRYEFKPWAMSKKNLMVNKHPGKK